MDRKKILKQKIKIRQKRKIKIRQKISGTPSIPRLSIFKSNKFLHAQAIDDQNAKTIVSLNSKQQNLGKNIDSANKMGKEFAKLLKKKKIDTLKFDRNGYLYHGAVKSFADSIREEKIKL